MERANTATSALQLQFDEFEEFSEVLKSLEQDQEQLIEACKQTEQSYQDNYNDLKVKVNEMQGKVDDFLTDMEKDISEKKGQLMKEMRETIEMLRKQQKKSTDLIETLQQKLIEASKEMEVKLNSVEKKFEDTVQVKTQFDNFYSASVSYLAHFFGQQSAFASHVMSLCIFL